MKKKFMALYMLIFASSSHYVTASGGSKIKSKTNAPTSAGTTNSNTFIGRLSTWISSVSSKAPEISSGKQAEISSTGTPSTATDVISTRQNSNVQDGIQIKAPKDQSQATSSRTMTVNGKTVQPFNRSQNQVKPLTNILIKDVAHSAYKNIASLGKPQGRQEFVKNVSEMLSKAGQSVPTAASFNAFFSKITPNMSMPNFTALFNKLIGKKTKVAPEPEYLPITYAEENGERVDKIIETTTQTAEKARVAAAQKQARKQARVALQKQTQLAAQTTPHPVPTTQPTIQSGSGGGVDL